MAASPYPFSNRAPSCCTWRRRPASCCRAICEEVASDEGCEVVWQAEETVAMPGFTKLEYGVGPVRFAMRGQKPRDLVDKFEQPYKPLLDAGVRFYAALGNHDSQSNRFYKPWNMNGERYYAFSKKNVKFFALDSDYMDPKQLQWVDNELKGARDDWKIVYFHHPLYSSGGRHGSEVDLRVTLEPLFVKYGVNVVYSGHDHIYERIKPQ